MPEEMLGVVVEVAGQLATPRPLAEAHVEFSVQVPSGVGRLTLTAVAVLPDGQAAEATRQIVAFST